MQNAETGGFWIEKHHQQEKDRCQCRIEYVVYTLGIDSHDAHNGKDIEQCTQNPNLPSTRLRGEKGGYSKYCQQAGKDKCPK